VLEALEPITGLGTRAFREIAPDTPALAAPPAPPPALSECDRERVQSALGPQPVDIDEIGRATGLSVREVRIAIMELDLAGRIERHGQQLVSLRPAASA
jgi:DNA processing protein